MKRLLFLAMIVLVCGCKQEQRPEGFPKLYPCRIEIRQDGKPLKGFSVSFMPSNPETNKWSSGGVADATGTARPRTHGRFNGMPEGTYKVVVIKQESEGERVDIPLNATEEEKQRFEKRIRENPYRVFDVIDVRYRSFQTTPLEIQVKPDSANRFTLDVGKAVREPVNVL